MYLHESLNSEKFKTNKKLLLVKQGVITLEQFIALLEDSDPYMMIGPAVVDKDFIDQYIEESQVYTDNVEHQQNKKHNFTNIQLVEKLLNLIPMVKDNLPEIERSLNSLYKQIVNNKCQTCVIIKYIGMFIGMTSIYVYDGRDNSKYIDQYEEIKSVIDNSKPYDNVNSILAKLDNNWIAPEQMLKLGDDLVEGLQSCLDCVIKHLERSKILCGEMVQGYPNYKEILSNEMLKSIEVYEAFYLKYWDVLGELDMASNEMVGDIKSLNGNKLVNEIINQANTIRKARIDLMFSHKLPQFSKLMLDTKKIQLYMKSMIK